ncbi:MAG TPA: sulfotransferase, partial [Acidimicrobiia bacterium]|nr:sulfotransferase [Acidimicrobiia bacterium]
MTITEPFAETPTRTTSGALFIAGPDRSGTTLMYALLASHPDVSMVRRTNMWRYFHRRYGDLGDAQNLDRCLADMVAYRRMRHLNPDEARIRQEFVDGPP